MPPRPLTWARPWPRWLRNCKVSILAFGSTDLTHYGPNYGFAPKGDGAEALKWVKEVNDKHFIDQALKLDGPGMLQAASQDQSACSAGGAVAAVAVATGEGARRALLTTTTPATISCPATASSATPGSC